MNLSRFSTQDLAAGYLPVKELYDYIRIVNPINRQVEIDIHPQFKKNESHTGNCYGFWNQGRTCDNCISFRSYQAADTFVKIEYNGTKLFLITAVSLLIDGQQRVLELLKDITENGFVDIQGQNGKEVSRMVKQINDLIVRDMQTGIYNKRYAYERLPHDLSKGIKERGLAVIFICIDNLEAIKSSYGYAAGDQVINRVTNSITGCCQQEPEAWLARFGEAEFLAVLPHTDSGGAQMLYQQMEHTLKSIQLDWQGNLASIRASLGMHSIEPVNENVMTLDDILAYTDTSIARARELARENRIMPMYDSFFAGFGLSKRECEVAHLLLEGLTNDDIAQTLFISLPTVKKHLSSIYQKSRTTSRAEFLAIFHAFQSSHLG